jgi:hypothetical protein
MTRFRQFRTPSGPVGTRGTEPIPMPGPTPPPGPLPPDPVPQPGPSPIPTRGMRPV